MLSLSGTGAKVQVQQLARLNINIHKHVFALCVCTCVRVFEILIAKFKLVEVVLRRQRLCIVLFTHNCLNWLLTDFKIKLVYSPLCDACVRDFTPLQWA